MIDEPVNTEQFHQPEAAIEMRDNSSDLNPHNHKYGPSYRL